MIGVLIAFWGIMIPFKIPLLIVVFPPTFFLTTLSFCDVLAMAMSGTSPTPEVKLAILNEARASGKMAQIAQKTRRGGQLWQNFQSSLSQER